MSPVRSKAQRTCTGNHIWGRCDRDECDFEPSRIEKRQSFEVLLIGSEFDSSVLREALLIGLESIRGHGRNGYWSQLEVAELDETEAHL